MWLHKLCLFCKSSIINWRHVSDIALTRNLLTDDKTKADLSQCWFTKTFKRRSSRDKISINVICFKILFISKKKKGVFTAAWNVLFPFNWTPINYYFMVLFAAKNNHFLLQRMIFASATLQSGLLHHFIDVSLSLVICNFYVMMSHFPPCETLLKSIIHCSHTTHIWPPVWPYSFWHNQPVSEKSLGFNFSNEC